MSSNDDRQRPLLEGADGEGTDTRRPSPASRDAPDEGRGNTEQRRRSVEITESLPEGVSGVGEVLEMAPGLKKIFSAGPSAPHSAEAPCSHCGAESKDRIAGCEDGNAPEDGPPEWGSARSVAPRYRRCPYAAEMDRRSRVRRHAEVSGAGHLGLHQTFDNFDPEKCADPDTADLYRNLAALLDSLADAREGSTSPSSSQSLSTRPGRLIIGGTGSGKSHLLRAVTIEACERGLAARFVECYRLLRRIRESYSPRHHSAASDERPQSASEIMEQVAEADVICIDDLGSEDSSEHSGQILFELVDILLSAQRMVLITTNLSDKDIGRRYGERVLSRLSELCELWTLRYENDHRVS